MKAKGKISDRADPTGEEALREALKETTTLLMRYRMETPPGHSPHMICYLADSAIERANALLTTKPAQGEPSDD